MLDCANGYHEENQEAACKGEETLTEEGDEEGQASQEVGEEEGCSEKDSREKEGCK